MSTYSSSLRLELIGTGTQAGTWGNTTNDNLSTVIDQAIAGYISVSVASSSQALTYLNGPTSTASANESIRAALDLTTSTGANFAVYAPPVSKLYVIRNSSSYVATVYNSTAIGNTTAAGTGVAIPAGKTMTVWSDGTNFAQQNDHLISPTLASPAMSGTPTTPTAALGTNTTQVASTAFVQAALSAVYPVGAVYISTSATNPGTTFGFGTWTAFGAGRTLIGAGGGYTAGTTGGSADAIVVDHTHTASSTFTGTALGTHTHTATQDAHSHTLTAGGYNSSNGFIYNNGAGFTYNGSSSTTTAQPNITVSSASAGTPAGTVSTTVANTGSSGTGANLPPYIVTYIWQRTA